MFEAVFKELKLVKNIEIDRPALINHAEKDVKESFWKAHVKASAVKCLNEFNTKKEKILREIELPPFFIQKDQCNPIFMFMTRCMHIEQFLVKIDLVFFNNLKLQNLICRIVHYKLGVRRKDAINPKLGSKPVTTHWMLSKSWLEDIFFKNE